MKERKQRRMAVMYDVVNLLRTVEIPEHVAIKGALCLGRWQGVSDSGCWDPRPTLMEFANPRHRERFMESSGRMKTITKGVFAIVPDDAAISRIMAEDAKRADQDSIPRGAPK